MRPLRRIPDERAWLADFVTNSGAIFPAILSGRYGGDVYLQYALNHVDIFSIAEEPHVDLLNLGAVSIDRPKQRVCKLWLAKLLMKISDPSRQGGADSAFAKLQVKSQLQKYPARKPGVVKQGPITRASTPVLSNRWPPMPSKQSQSIRRKTPRRKHSL